MAVVTTRQLLEAGFHFGHQTRRWNPKMKRFIHSERNGIYIVDVRQTIERLQQAYAFTRDLVSHGGTLLFVGTKRQAKEPIEYHATRVGMPYVTERWLGGMLTNFETIKGRIARLRELEAMEAQGLFEILPKKEVLELQREHARLQTNLGGIRDMSKLPDAMWVIDTVNEEIAVREANRLRIPVIAILDTNCDPDLVQYPIPGNDDAIRSVALMTRIIGDACADGLLLRASRSPDEELREQAMKAAATTGSGLDVAEPKAQWEIELERQQAARLAAAAGVAPSEQAEAQSTGPDEREPAARTGQPPEPAGHTGQPPEPAARTGQPPEPAEHEPADGPDRDGADEEPAQEPEQGAPATS